MEKVIDVSSPVAAAALHVAGELWLRHPKTFREKQGKRESIEQIAKLAMEGSLPPPGPRAVQ
jgi:hypothetical protein